jgi:hypothetical protein
MKIFFAGTQLTDWADYPAQGVAVNGQCVTEDVAFVRAVQQRSFPRGNSSITLQFSVSKVFASLRDAQSYLLTIFSTLPKSGQCQIICGAPDEALYTTVTFASAVLSAMPQGNLNCLEVTTQFTINAGASPVVVNTGDYHATYSFDGDTNGVFYYIGKNYLSGGPWSNPYISGRLAITSVDNTGGDNKATIVDHAASHYSTSNVYPTIMFDLGVGHSLVLNRYSYRYRDETATFCPTAWVLSASNDDFTYTMVDAQTGLAVVQNGWVSPAVPGQVTPYRYWKIAMTGNNNSGTTHFSIGELELYGALSY